MQAVAHWAGDCCYTSLYVPRHPVLFELDPGYIARKNQSVIQGWSSFPLAADIGLTRIRA